MSGPWLAAFVALWIVVMVLAGLVLGLLRRVEGILTRAESHSAAMIITPKFGLHPGELVPAFMGHDASGRPVDSSDVLSAAPLVFLFVEEGCRPCGQLVTDLATEGWQANTPLVLVASNQLKSREWLNRSLGGVSVLFEENNRISDAFATGVTPNAFLVGDRRTVIAQFGPASLSALRSWATAITSSEKEVVESREIAVPAS
jgi:hypothetical protein